jgi:hypothetical protein
MPPTASPGVRAIGQVVAKVRNALSAEIFEHGFGSKYDEYYIM